jgi:anti-anti-sigma factor
LPEKLTSVAFTDSGSRVVKLSGELDLVTAANAREALSEDFDVIDFSELKFLDSSGLRVPLQTCRDLPQRPIARGLGGQVRRILDLTGLLDLFVIEDAGLPDAGPPSS